MAKPDPRQDLSRYRRNQQGEVDSAALYQAMAEAETKPELAAIYRRLAAAEAARGEPQPTGSRQVFLDVRRGWQQARVYDYRTLKAGARIEGPSVVEAPTTTVAIPQGCSGTVDRLGNLVLRYTD